MMAYKSQTRERCQVSAVLIVRENNCERAWVSATLGCRAVRGVTSQLGRQGRGPAVQESGSDILQMTEWHLCASRQMDINL